LRADNGAGGHYFQGLTFMADVLNFRQQFSPGCGDFFPTDIHRGRAVASNARIHDLNTDTGLLEAGGDEKGLPTLGIHGGDYQRFSGWGHNHFLEKDF
jgi:hypothetical protein